MLSAVRTRVLISWKFENENYKSVLITYVNIIHPQLFCLYIYRVTEQSLIVNIIYEPFVFFNRIYKRHEYYGWPVFNLVEKSKTELKFVWLKMTHKRYLRFSVSKQQTRNITIWNGYRTWIRYCVCIMSICLVL